MEKTFDETKKEGFLADLKGIVGKHEPILFGKYAFHNPTNSVANKFVCTEETLKVPPRLYACGKLANGTLGAPSWASLILSTKSREQLLGASTKMAKMCLLGG